MGNNEEGKSSKSDRSSSPTPPEQTNVHVYPDWAAMQAYYGPRVALPPYYNSAVASGHAPHPYLWGHPQFSQPMMPPYGSPYAPMYAHGGIYPHPTVPLASRAHGHGVPLSPAAATPMSVETPEKPSGHTNCGLMKKLKGFDGLAMSIGSGTAESVEDGTDHGMSKSMETEGSSDGSNENTAGVNQTRRKRSREGTPIIGEDENTGAQNITAAAGEANATSDKVLVVGAAPTSCAGKMVGTITPLNLRNSPVVDVKTSPPSIPQPCAVLPSETWVQNERELKRERRKQSNRESARRSRLRKQAEAEELALKVESLNAENSALKSEIERLTENSDKLRLDNGTLLEKLKNGKLGQRQELTLDKVTDKRSQPVSTENLLSRVNNPGPVDRSPDEESGMYATNSNSGAKLHQLLNTSPRNDAVAAS